MMVSERYKESDKRTIENMRILFNSLEDEEGAINESYLLSLDLIAQNYDLLYEASDDIKVNGLRQVDQKNRESKNDSIQIFNNAQRNITNILNQFGKTPMSRSKIKGNSDDISAADLLSQLTEL